MLTNRQNIIRKVQKIIEDVKGLRDDAIVKYTKLFDNIENFSKKDIKLLITISPKIKDKDFILAINHAIENVKKFHIEEFKNLKRIWNTKYSGLIVGQKYIPIESVGIYIPGGRYGYNYISTLLMTIIPAQVAGVKKIIVTTPPKNVSDYFIYTVFKLGIREIYRVGGVQAIASLAFGTESIPKVDMIVGPGNIWVTEAKRQLVGVVGIDLLAGPSEVVVVADKFSDLEKVAFELLAQAEHDKDAKGYLISLDENFARKIREYINYSAKEFSAQIEVIYEPRISKICDIVNKIAPEHLTLFTKRYKEIIKNIKNAGAIFCGDNPSAVFGDYIVGPSHVLPTNSSARFSSGICVASFLKKMSIVQFAKNSTKLLSEHTAKLAEIEGMKWHRKRVIG